MTTEQYLIRLGYENAYETRRERWKADQQRKLRRLAKRIYKTLDRGGEVAEVWGDNKTLSIWKAGDAAEAAGCFLPEYRTPAFLTRHLVNRQGFGFELLFA